METNLKSFTDYRSFLLAHIQDEKRKNSKWSYGMWARRLGLSDVSSITKIVQGARHPGPQITEKLVAYFNFKNKDAQYFRDLVRLHKIKKDPRLAVMLMEKMGKEYPKGSIRILDDKSFNLISNWYTLAIREMVRVDSFFEDPKWIAKSFNFHVTPTEVAKAIELLMEVELLERDQEGNLQITDGTFHTQNDTASEAIKRYHESMLDNAKSAIRQIDITKREFTASTFVMRDENVPKATELIRDFKSKFIRLLEEDGGENLYQIQMQFFPLTNNKKRSIQ